MTFLTFQNRYGSNGRQENFEKLKKNQCEGK